VHAGVDGQPVGQLLLAPVDGTAEPRAVGPLVTDLQDRHEFMFSPDGRTILLTSTDPDSIATLSSYLIDVASNTFVEGSRANENLIGFYASWQRLLAP
jgi:hypothetical protein